MTPRGNLKGAIDAHDADLALDEKERRSLRQLAKSFGVSLATLSTRLSKLHEPVDTAHAHRQALTPAEEAELIPWIDKMARLGFPPTRLDVQGLAKLLLNERCTDVEEHPPSHVSLGCNWVDRFRKRHPEVASVWTKSMDSARIESATYEGMKPYFDELSQLFDQHHYRAGDVYNLDETGFCMGATGSTRVMVVKDVERDSRVRPGKAPKRSTQQEWATILECVSASGRVLAPLVIFKGQTTFLPHWLPEGVDTSHWRWSVSNKGWTSDTLAFDWLKDVFEPQTKTPSDAPRRRLLLLDEHLSHTRAQFARFCHTHDIDLVVFPAHTSQITQPLDLALFGPLKHAMNQQNDRESRRSSGNRLAKSTFSLHLVRARQEAFTPSNIKSGFKSAGIWPLDPSHVLSKVTRPSTPPQRLARTPLSSLQIENREIMAAASPILNTPVKNHIKRLREYGESEHARRIIAEKAAEDSRAAAKAPKRATGRRTVAQLGTHVIATEEVILRLEEADLPPPAEEDRQEAENQRPDYSAARLPSPGFMDRYL